MLFLTDWRLAVVEEQPRSHNLSVFPFPILSYPPLCNSSLECERTESMFDSIYPDHRAQSVWLFMWQLMFVGGRRGKETNVVTPTIGQIRSKNVTVHPQSPSNEPCGVEIGGEGDWTRIKTDKPYHWNMQEICCDYQLEWKICRSAEEARWNKFRIKSESPGVCIDDSSFFACPQFPDPISIIFPYSIIPTIWLRLRPTRNRSQLEWRWSPSGE